MVAWGDNNFAELGNGSTSFDHATPGPVYGLSGVKAVAGTEHNGYALKADGTVWSWDYGHMANWATASTDTRPVPACRRASRRRRSR